VRKPDKFLIAVFNTSLRLLLAVVFLTCSLSVRAEIVWHWQHSFTASEKRKVQQWITQTVRTIERQVAPYPFDVHLYFYRRTGRGEPVPWANTRRDSEQGVNFHIDPDYPLQAFLDDWTAPHELSHLLIPYLGRRHAWLAEGFASFMQFRVMQAMGILSDEQMLERYRVRIERAAGNYRADAQPFAVAAPTLHRSGQQPTMYWGGAVYFLQIDRALREQGDSLQRVLASYVECCRAGNHGLSGLIAELDRISASTLFSSALRENQSRPGFPMYENLFPVAETDE